MYEVLGVSDVNLLRRQKEKKTKKSAPLPLPHL